MPINKKKPIRMRNRTNHFDPAVSRGFIQFSSPDSYQSRKIKIEGYETRLYWQFRYCEDHSGQTFFYTLTYNDKAMPQYKLSSHESFNCFDYEDLRDLLTGGFRKQLLRKYGTTFKYFISAELGDGKGSRGLANNPHYHALFFLEPADNPQYPYIKISPEEFRHLIRLYWQGFDEEEEIQDYRTAKFGIAKEGSENLGKVKDFRAEMYGAKYVCKDVKLVRNERKVVSYKRLALRNVKYPVDCCKQFFYDVICRIYASKGLTPQELLDHFVPHTFDLERSLEGSSFDPNSVTLDLFNIYVPDICRVRKGLWKRYWKFKKAYDEEQLRLTLNEYRNRYCNKCRVSHGLGDYALKFIDKLEPFVEVPDKDKGWKRRPLSMYYYRKLYTTMVKDINGSPIYIINADGIDYKCHNLPKQVSKLATKAKNLFALISTDPDLYERIRESDINNKVFMHFPEFLRRYDYLFTDNNDNEQIFTNYAYYKLIYEDRYLPAIADGSGRAFDFPPLEPLADYRRFLAPTFPRVYRNPDGVAQFFASPNPNFIPWQSHPAFLRYISLYDLLDTCSDYFFVQEDNRSQAEAEEIARTKRFHTKEKLNDFYSKFKNTTIYN